MEIYVDRYEHVDYLPQTERGSFEVFKTFHQSNFKRKTLKQLKEMYTRERDEVEKAFVKNGWEGGGTLMCVWLPSFINHNLEETYGSYIWHVKQQSNGTSFFGIDKLSTRFTSFQKFVFRVIRRIIKLAPRRLTIS